MSVDSAVAQMLDAGDLGHLQVGFRRLCSYYGEVKFSQVLLAGSYGSLHAFCAVEMKDAEAQEQLVRRMGFRPLGNLIYLPVSLPVEFERRTVARVA